MNKRKPDYEKNEDKFFTPLYPSINTLLEKFGFEHKIIKPLPNKIVTYEGKTGESDFIGLLDNKDILNLEAHSSKITLEDKKKFFDYASYYSIKCQKKDIKVHTLVLSSYYKNNNRVNYKWHGSSQFTIPYKSFNTFDAEKTINKIRLKNKNNTELDKYDIDDLRILTFMKSDKSHKELLIESVKLTNDATMDQVERNYTKALQSLLANKFIEDEEEYIEVMEMIERNFEEFSDPFGRLKRILKKREEEIEKKEEEIERMEEELKKEKEKNEKNIENMKDEMKRRGYGIEEIQAICQVAK